MTAIQGFVCRACGTRIYPRHARCPSCGAREFDSVPIMGKGKLLTFTRVHMLSLAFTDRFITLGIVEYDDGLRALGRIAVDEPQIGMDLEAEIGTVRMQDGEEIKGLCFREALG